MNNALRVLHEAARRLEDAAERTRPILEASAPGAHRKVTIGMVANDDVDGVRCTIEAIHLYHPEVTDDVGFVVVDDHPAGPAAHALKHLEHELPHYRYVPFRGYRGIAVLDEIFRQASSDHVICVEPRVMFRAGALAAMLTHLDEHPNDLVHAPLLASDGQHPRCTHLEARWVDGSYGQPAVDPRAADPQHPAFEISMGILEMVGCRRAAWPGLNPRLRGCGDAGYLHEKFRRAGGRIVCLPAAGYVRRHGYPLDDEAGLPDRIRNHAIGCHELGLDADSMEQHLQQHLGAAAAAALLDPVRAEIASPLAYFDGIVCVQIDDHADEWPAVWQRFDALGVGRTVERLPAIRTPDNHHRGCALSHRAAVAEAKRRGLANVLVVEEDAIFLDDTLAVVQRVLEDLEEHPWDLLYLGGLRHKLGGARTSPVPGSEVLEIPHYLTTSHCVAYNGSAFDRILDEVPSGGAELERWLAEYLAIDQYLPRRALEGAFRAFVTNPRVASQPALTNWDAGDRPLADRYTIR